MNITGFKPVEVVAHPIPSYREVRNVFEMMFVPFPIHERLISEIRNYEEYPWISPDCVCLRGIASFINILYQHELLNTETLITLTSQCKDEFFLDLYRDFSNFVKEERGLDFVGNIPLTDMEWNDIEPPIIVLALADAMKRRFEPTMDKLDCDEFFSVIEQSRNVDDLTEENMSLIVNNVFEFLESIIETFVEYGLINTQLLTDYCDKLFAIDGFSKGGNEERNKIRGKFFLKLGLYRKKNEPHLTLVK